MFRRLAYYYSSYHFIIIITSRIFSHHSRIKSIHKLLILFGGMAACTIFPHHIPDSRGFGDAEVLDVGVNLLVATLHLPDYRQNIDRLDVGD